MHVVMRRDRRAVEGGRLVMPAAESGFDFLVDAMTDRLHDLCFDNVPLRIDSNFDDDVAGEASGKLGTIHGRIGIDGWISHVHIVPENGPINDAAERRACFGIDRSFFGS